MTISKEAQKLRALDYRMGRIKDEWMEDEETSLFINSFYQFLADNK